ncbi:MAG: integration host factor subunit alpha [Desulfuromonadales bacterium]
MTKADLAELIYEHLNRVGRTSKKDSLDLVDLTFEVVKRAIVEEGKLKVAGFGNFEVRQKNTRRGRNPHTGEEMPIAARRILIFKASQILKHKVNDSKTEGERERKRKDWLR